MKHCQSALVFCLVFFDDVRLWEYENAHLVQWMVSRSGQRPVVPFP